MGPYVYVALWHHCHGEEVAVLLSDREDLTKEEVERRLSDLNWGNFDPASDMEWISLDGPITPIGLKE